MPTALDIDNVLCPTDSVMINLLNSRFHTHYARSQLTNYSLEISLGLPDKQVAYAQELWSSSEFYLSMPVLPRAAEGAQMISDYDDVVYMTCRPTCVAEVTLEWLYKHEFPAGDLLVGLESKIPKIRELKIEALVEDSPTTAVETVTKCRIPVYLFTAPYNKHIRRQMVTHVADWSELIDIIQEGQ